MHGDGIIKVFWSEEDQEWVATHTDFESLSYLADSPEEAVNGLVELLDGI